MKVSKKIGKRIYNRIVRAGDPQAALDELTNQDLERLNGYVAKLPSDGVPGLISAMVNAEKIIRWDDVVGECGEKVKKQFMPAAPVKSECVNMDIEDLPAGGTTAEGMDLAHREAKK